jgi:hypothetical protein
MKKIKKYSSFFIFMFCMFMTSCSSEINEIVQQREEMYIDSKAIQELKVFNDKTLESKGNKIMRGGIPRWVTISVHDAIGAYCGGKTGAAMGGKIGLVAGSPITGATFGGFLGAVGWGALRSALKYHDTCSYACTPEDFQNNFVNKACPLVKKYYDDLQSNLNIKENDLLIPDSLCEQIDVDEQILDSVNMDNHYLYVGKLHNIILSSLDNSTQVGEDISLSMRSSLNYEDIEEDINFTYISSQMDWNEFYDEANQMTIELEADTVNSKVDYVMTLFADIFSSYSSEITDVVMLINKYAAVVKASDEFTEEEKEYIMYGLATALYSYNYWEVEYLK